MIVNEIVQLQFTYTGPKNCTHVCLTYEATMIGRTTTCLISEIVS
uniref:Uncharacterized protein n=1 Tax=Arundo donax TaxID=35708 RepID=A0A0A8ZHG0_ARUDO